MYKRFIDVIFLKGIFALWKKHDQLINNALHVPITRWSLTRIQGQQDTQKSLINPHYVRFHDSRFDIPGFGMESL